MTTFVGRYPIRFPDATTEALDIYVDGSAGSDTTGDGSESAPYETFLFLDWLPKERNHLIHIHVAAGTYTYFPSKVNIDNLLIDASGEDYTEIGGPFTISAVSRISGAMGGQYFETDLQVSGSPGWTPKEFRNAGYFIHVLTGNWAGKILPLITNGTDTVRVGWDEYVFATSDTFNIVDTPVRVEVDHAIEFYGAGRVQDYIAKGAIAGLDFYCSDDSLSVPFIIDQTSLAMVFCKLSFAGDSYRGFVHTNESSLNCDYIDNTLDDNDINDLWAYALQFVPLDGVAPTDSDGAYDLYVKNTDLGTGICCRRGVLVSSGKCNAYAIVCSGISIWDNALMWLDWSVCDDVDTVGLLPAFDLSSQAFADISSCYVNGCDRALVVRYGCYARVDWFQGDNIVDDYAILVGPVASVYRDSTDADVVGVVGAIEFVATGTQVTAWPSDDVLADGAGSFVIDL